MEVDWIPYARLVKWCSFRAARSPLAHKKQTRPICVYCAHWSILKQQRTTYGFFEWFMRSCLIISKLSYMTRRTHGAWDVHHTTRGFCYERSENIYTSTDVALVRTDAANRLKKGKMQITGCNESIQMCWCNGLVVVVVGHPWWLGIGIPCTWTCTSALQHIRDGKSIIT